MPAPKGSKNGLGNKGGRRKSAYEEHRDAKFAVALWNIGIDFKKLERRVLKPTGLLAAKDVFAYLVLNAVKNRRDAPILKLADKLLPDKLSDGIGEGFAALATAVRDILKKKNE